MRQIISYGSILFLSIVSFLLDNAFFQIVFLLKSSFLDIILGWASNFGNVFLILVVVTTLFLWQEHKRQWIPSLWLSYLSTITVVFLLKIIIARQRPFFPLQYPILGMMNYAMPSMHAAAAFAALPVLDREFPKLKWFWLVFAFFVAFSRVYLLEHYLSDVVVGAFLGFIIGKLFVHWEENYRPFDGLK